MSADVSGKGSADSHCHVLNDNELITPSKPVAEMPDCVLAIWKNYDGQLDKLAPAQQLDIVCFRFRVHRRRGRVLYPISEHSSHEDENGNEVATSRAVNSDDSTPEPPQIGPLQTNASRAGPRSVTENPEAESSSAALRRAENHGLGQVDGSSHYNETVVDPNSASHDSSMREVRHRQATSHRDALLVYRTALAAESRDIRQAVARANSLQMQQDLRAEGIAVRDFAYAAGGDVSGRAQSAVPNRPHATARGYLYSLLPGFLARRLHDIGHAQVAAHAPRRAARAVGGDESDWREDWLEALRWVRWCACCGCCCCSCCDDE
ncbi:hypothetical protein HIM_05879 [Hirsutella minnesotensis 3608]|uniref:Uncharacterized protein n=1 Tax=Hirsutella minnesotensis 3608 TaxID=1043627 RepID=A0A0F7ZZT4_9HYPO|nr:hypothetical protein HIM_05879 [Hirsutella minnesotensis 3608]